MLSEQSGLNNHVKSEHFKMESTVKFLLQKGDLDDKDGRLFMVPINSRSVLPNRKSILVFCQHVQGYSQTFMLTRAVAHKL